MASPLPDPTIGFAAVARWPEVAAAITDAAAGGRWSGPLALTAICAAASLPQTRQNNVLAVLEAGAAHSLFLRHSPLVWSPLASVEEFGRLSWMLLGAATYRGAVHQEADEVDVVLTQPSRPSELERALREAGYEQIGLVATAEMFPAMAMAASSAFTVMTPFLDEAGAAHALALFSACRATTHRRLIIRAESTGMPPAYLDIVERLRDLRVQVFNYRLPREGAGFETFHAKVLLADRNWAYVGSANMNLWSLAYSMELGVSLRGRAAGRVARVADAIVKVSNRVA